MTSFAGHATVFLSLQPCSDTSDLESLLFVSLLVYVWLVFNKIDCFDSYFAFIVVRFSQFNASIAKLIIGMYI